MGKIFDLITIHKSKFSGSIGWRLEKHCAVVEDFLNPGEEVSYAFFGQLNESWQDFFSTCVVVVTNKRLLIGQKRILWGSSYMQITPDLYNDMEVYQGLFFGKIVIDTVKEELVISNLSRKALPEIETAISEFMLEAKKKLGK